MSFPASTPLDRGLTRVDFPQILQYLSSQRKAIILCPTIELIHRVYLYLWRMEPAGINHFRRICMYHSLCSDDCNQQTLLLLDNDPMALIVIAFVAFANGINVRSLLNISITFPKHRIKHGNKKGASEGVRKICVGASF